MSSISMHCDSQPIIHITKNNSYNKKNQHMRLSHEVMKQLLRDGIIFIDFVRLEMKLADSLTKCLGIKLILGTSRGMGLKPIV
jgi:hypothetical protein